MLVLKSQKEQFLRPTLLILLQARSQSRCSSDSHRLWELQTAKDTRSGSSTNVTTTKDLPRLYHQTQTWSRDPSQRRREVTEEGHSSSLRRQQHAAECKNKGERNESCRWRAQNQTRNSGFFTHNPAKRFSSSPQDVVHAKHLHELKERLVKSQSRHLWWLLIRWTSYLAGKVLEMLKDQRPESWEMCHTGFAQFSHPSGRSTFRNRVQIHQCYSYVLS